MNKFVVINEVFTSICVIGSRSECEGFISRSRRSKNGVFSLYELVRHSAPEYMLKDNYMNKDLGDISGNDSRQKCQAIIYKNGHEYAICSALSTTHVVVMLGGDAIGFPSYACDDHAKLGK